MTGLPLGPHDPFRISFDAFQKLDREQFKSFAREVQRDCFILIEDAWKRGMHQIVICDKKIVYETESKEPISSQMVKDLSRKHNKACYVFVAPDTIEETGWLQTNHAKEELGRNTTRKANKAQVLRNTHR